MGITYLIGRLHFIKVLITGSGGKLGSELAKNFPNSLTPTHNSLDITERENVFRFINEIKPDIIFHCAAITGVRDCEEKKALAWKVNVNGTENLIDACIEYSNSCFFIYISTACVFYGDKGNYSEIDIPQPKNFYALTKLLSEFIVKRSGIPKWLIIRTNFVGREQWPYPKAFVDRYGTYLFADDLALAIKSVVEEQITGLVHVCGKEKLSMFELAKITTPNIQPTTLAEYVGPPLTKDMTLKSERIKEFSITR